MEEINKEEYASLLAQRAEKALKLLKITVIITAVCAVALPAVSLILLVALENPAYGLTGLIISLCIFVAMLGVLVGVIFFVRKQVRRLKELDNKENE